MPITVISSGKVIVRLAGVKGEKGDTGEHGPAGISWKGAWANDIEYVAYDAVAHGDDNYISLVDNNLDHEPPEGASNSYWQLLAAGVQGDPGLSILHGAAVPTTEGVDGEFYIRTVSVSDYRLYGPKAGGTWPSTYISMVGTKGDQGDPGNDGSDGNDGQDGVNGQDGVGIQGPTGSPGSMAFKGLWVTDTYYYENELTQHTKTDYGLSVYIVKSGQGHTSGDTTEPEVGEDWEDYWELYSEGGQDGEGVGDVVGPGGSTADRIAVFDGATGKLLKDGGKKIADLLLATTKLDQLGTPTDNTSLDVSSSLHGLCPKAPASGLRYLGAGGAWQYRVVEEEPSGTGSTLTLAHTPLGGSLRLFKNGMRLRAGSGNDYTLATATLTLATAKEAGDVFLADYEHA